MGDRANIVIKQHDNSRVWLYTHWTGYLQPAVLAAALLRGSGRWNDSPYLARIIFCEMVKGQEMGESGFGISTQMTDNEYPILVVDPDKMTVAVESEEGRNRDNAAIGLSMSIGDYVKLDFESAGREKAWQVLIAAKEAQDKAAH